MRLTTCAILPAAALALAACEMEPPADVVPPADIGPPAQLGVFGDGYPNPGDPCRRSGETEFTGMFLDDAADLVSCPPGVDATVFSADTGGVQVAELEGWSVFSIPTR